MHFDDAARLHALRDYRVLDSAPEEVFDNIAQLVTHIIDAPIALVSLIDEHRQWFKSKVGLDVPETPRDIAFCDHAIRQDEPLIVRDASCDERFKHNPLVTADPSIRFYCGVPLRTPEGHALGTLCVIDRKPRAITEAQLEALRLLARQVEIELEIRRRLEMLEEVVVGQEKAQHAKDLLASMIVHDLRSPLTAIVLLGSTLRVSSDASRDSLADLLAEAERARLMLTDILDVCLHSRGELRLRPSAFVVQSRMKDIEQRMARLARQRSQRVVLDLPETPFEIEADVEILDRVFSNLIINAMQHGPAEQQITVAVSLTAAGGMRAEVRDQGEPIAAFDGESLFRAFEEDTVATRASSRTRGHGLGLAFCRLAVEAHGGSIGFESRAGSGNTFYFELPARPHRGDAAAH